MTTDTTSAAQIAVFLLLLQPALYCVWKHGKTGFLGWFYATTFCSLRIVTGGLNIHGVDTSTAALIINSIGLSPLLLGTTGVLHEARRATVPRVHRKREIILEILYHGVASLGMLMITVAMMNLKEDKASRNKTLIAAGSGLLGFSWILLAAWAIWTFIELRGRGAYVDSPTVADGSILLYAVLAATTIALFRLIYALVYLHKIVSDPTASFLTSKAAKIILSVIPEMLVVGVLVLAGVKTRHLKRGFEKLDRGQPTPVPRDDDRRYDVGYDSTPENNTYYERN